jgi:hypothetical protein
MYRDDFACSRGDQNIRINGACKRTQTKQTPRVVENTQAWSVGVDDKRAASHRERRRLHRAGSYRLGQGAVQVHAIALDLLVEGRSISCPHHPSAAVHFDGPFAQLSGSRQHENHVQFCARQEHKPCHHVLREGTAAVYQSNQKMRGEEKTQAGLDLRQTRRAEALGLVQSLRTRVLIWTPVSPLIQGAQRMWADVLAIFGLAH